MSTIKSAWSSMPRWARWLIGLFVVSAIFRGIVGEPASTSTSAPQSKTVQSTPAPKKNAGERALGSSLTGWTQSSDGRILAMFDIWSMTKDSVESDIKRIMRELTSERRTDWNEITISGYATATDKYGKKSNVVAYTITFSRSEAEKVESWDRADIVKVGIREFVVPQLQ